MNMNLQGGATQRSQSPTAGIDVSKLHLDVCLHADLWRTSNDAQGWEELAARLLAEGADLVVIEATGGYERGVVTALQAAGLSVARVNPRQARDFAKSMVARWPRPIAWTRGACATLPMYWPVTHSGASSSRRSSKPSVRRWRG